MGITVWPNWQMRLQPIRTAAEITAHIKILPVHQPYLYQKLSKKATELRLLGMTYELIAKSLNINKRTAMKAWPLFHLTVRCKRISAKQILDEAQRSLLHRVRRELRCSTGKELGWRYLQP